MDSSNPGKVTCQVQISVSSSTMSKRWLVTDSLPQGFMTGPVTSLLAAQMMRWNTPQQVHEWPQNRRHRKYAGGKPFRGSQQIKERILRPFLSRDLIKFSKYTTCKVLYLWQICTEDWQARNCFGNNNPVILEENKLSFSQHWALAEMKNNCLVNCVGKSVASKPRKVIIPHYYTSLNASGVMYSFGLPSTREILTYWSKHSEGPTQ